MAHVQRAFNRKDFSLQLELLKSDIRYKTRAKKAKYPSRIFFFFFLAVASVGCFVTYS